MDPTNGKASDFERRTSMRTSMRLSTAGDDDDYDLHAMSISDGFRPTNLAAAHVPIPSPPPSNLPIQSVLERPSTPRLVLPNRPSSIAKPPRPHDSLALRHDGATNPQPLGSVLSPVSSVSTDVSIPRSESPYEGPSGPSHPYQMYPQRTFSVATTSTTPMSEQSYAGPQGPTHPYGMYAQNTTPTDGPQGETIPVGFPGTTDNYQRRLGPDGEEVADLIGPLGHTEELPPYTRYPEAAYVVKPEPARPQLPAVAAAAPIERISGAGGIGLATRDPEFASRDDLDSPRSRLSARSFTSDASQHEINTAARDLTEKEQSRRWQNRAKKRVCGIIPYWAICLLAVALVIMGIILGAVIGTFFAKHKKPSDRPDNSFPQTMPWVDETPLTSLPPDLPPLDTGTWGLPPLIASQAPSTCFNDTTQAQAWTCNIPFTVYFMSIEKLPNEPPISDYTLRLTTFNNSGSMFSKYSWGTQPPFIIDPIRMILVNDTFAPGRGPAWFAQMTYNKTVIIAEDRFSRAVSSATIPKRTNWGSPPPPPSSNGGEFKGGNDYKRKGIMGAQEGDRPWICTWPGTILEVFVYPSQNNSFRNYVPPSNVPTGSWPPPTGSWPPPTGSWPPPTSIASYSSSSATGVSQSSPAATSTASPFRDMPKFEPPPAYPKVIKFEERRVSGNQETRAVCRQVEVIDDGQNTRPVLNEAGEAIEVIIEENEKADNSGAYSEPESKRWMPGSDIFSRDGPSTYGLSDCGCIWWFT